MREAEPAGDASQRQLRIALAAVLFVGTVLLYARSFSYPSINLDDPQYVFANDRVLSGLSADNAAWAFTTNTLGNWHPLTWLSYQLDATLFHRPPEPGKGPVTTATEATFASATPYRVHNVLLHAIDAALLFHVLWLMTGAVWRSAIVAALFAVHPLHVQSVVWVSERKDVLSTLFWLLAMWGYLRYARRHGIGWYAFVAVMLALGLMTKPMLVTLPCVLLLLDLWPLGRATPFTLARIGWLVLEKVPLFLIVAASAVITLQVQSQGGAVVALETMPVDVRLANALLSYAAYLVQTFWPTGLAMHYPYTHHSLSEPAAAFAALGLAAVTGACLWFARSRPYLLVGWLWFLGTLVPVIGLIQVGSQARADRYTYVPHIGLFIAVVWGVGEVLTRWVSREAAAVAGGLAVAGCVAMTTVQLGYWQSGITLWSHTLAVTREDNAVAQVGLGLAYAYAQKPAEALPHLKKAVELAPNDAETQRRLGIVYVTLNRLDEAIPPLLKAAQLDPKHKHTQGLVAELLMNRGRYDEAVAHLATITQGEHPHAAARVKVGVQLLLRLAFAPAREQFTRAITEAPNNADAHFQLGVVETFTGQYDAAIREMREAIRLDPNHAAAYSQLGVLLNERGQRDEALMLCERAVELKPTAPFFLTNLAMVLTAVGRPKDAESRYSEAIGYDADWITAALAQATRAALSPAKYDLLEARARARQACEATGYRNPNAIVVLAQVEAAGGRFREAVELCDKAAVLAEGNVQAVQQIRGLQELYKSGKSDRDVIAARQKPPG